MLSCLETESINNHGLKAPLSRLVVKFGSL